MFSLHLSYCIYYLITSSPLGKRFGFDNPNLCLSPFLYFALDFLRNLVNSQTSLTLERERLIDVDSLSRDWRGSCIDRGNEREDSGVKGEVYGT
jgi:hypothetical protein